MGSVWRDPLLVLGQELRQIRESAGVPISDVPGFSESKLRKIEHGRSATVLVRDVWDLLRQYGFTDQAAQERLFRLAEQTGRTDWIDKILDPKTGHYLFLRREMMSSRLRGHNASWLPALLQPREYTEEIYRRARWDQLDDDPVTSLRARTQWREDFYRRVDEGRTCGVFVVGEEALLRASAMGVRDVAVEELRAVDERPGVEVWVMPLSAGGYHGLGLEFTLLDFPSGDDGPIAWLGAVASSRIVHKEKDVEELRTIFDSCLDLAVRMNDTR